MKDAFRLCFSFFFLLIICRCLTKAQNRLTRAFLLPENEKKRKTRRNKFFSWLDTDFIFSLFAHEPGKFKICFSPAIWIQFKLCSGGWSFVLFRCIMASNNNDVSFWKTNSFWFLALSFDCLSNFHDNGNKFSHFWHFFRHPPLAGM